MSNGHGEGEKRETAWDCFSPKVFKINLKFILKDHLVESRRKMCMCIDYKYICIYISSEMIIFLVL